MKTGLYIFDVNIMLQRKKKDLILHAYNGKFLLFF